jgi:hypothetical protein
MGTLVVLPNLYASPSDIDDYLGATEVDLRLDDQQLATGQVITAVANAAAGAAALQVAALQRPLLAGSQLKFYGAGMPGIVYAVLSAVANIGDTQLAVAPLAGAVDQDAQATDSGVNLATAARMVKGCSYATARVKMYCANRYDDSQLCKSWSVNNWATIIASRWVSKRRAQSAPSGLAEDYEEAMKELNLVRQGSLCIEDIGTRTSGWPFITNSTIDVRYDIVKARVQPLLSEGTPTQYGQYVDWNSVFSIQAF